MKLLSGGGSLSKKMNRLITLFLLISLFSCAPQTEDIQVNISYTCEDLEWLLSEGNFILKEIEDDPELLSLYTEMYDNLSLLPKTTVVDYNMIYSYLGDKTEEFLEYNQNLASVFISLQESNLDCGLDHDDDLQSSKFLCCVGCEQEYVNCMRRAKRTAATTFTAHVVVGVTVTVITGGANGGTTILLSFVTGGIHATLLGLNERQLCAIEKDECHFSCRPPCNQ